MNIWDPFNIKHQLQALVIKSVNMCQAAVRWNVFVSIEKLLLNQHFFFNDHHFKSLNSTLGRSSLIFSSIIILSQLSGWREVGLDVKSELLFIFFSLKMDWILVKLFLSILFSVNFKNQSFYLQLTVFIVYRLRERLHGTVHCLKNQFLR